MDANKIEGTRSLDELLPIIESETRPLRIFDLNLTEAKIAITAT
jgi:hypothetical protein